jgi:hypothetical protein
MLPFDLGQVCPPPASRVRGEQRKAVMSTENEVPKPPGNNPNNHPQPHVSPATQSPQPGQNHPAAAGNPPGGPGRADSSPPTPPYPALKLPTVEPWPEAVDGKALLDNLVRALNRFVVLPKWAPEALALWILHTYAFLCRDVTTYIGLESPQKRCGKTTLLTVLSELVNRPVVAANISPPAFFRVIAETQPTLLIDEADTFLQGNEELRGILNSGYSRKTAFVVRVANQSVNHDSPANSPTDPPSQLASFSCWCPKVMATIGRFPETLADRCILIRMHRKTNAEDCERLRNLEPTTLRRQCARFALDHASDIASATPTIPTCLNDRAADIWEPLLALADLAGEPWPQLARDAAISFAASAHDNSPIASLFLDLLIPLLRAQDGKIFSRLLVAALNLQTDRPWAELRKGKPITELWLAQHLRPYGIRPQNLWINGEQAKGYLAQDFWDTFRRYIPKPELQAFLAQHQSPTPPPPAAAAEPPPDTRQTAEALPRLGHPPTTPTRQFSANATFSQPHNSPRRPSPFSLTPRFNGVAEHAPAGITALPVFGCILAPRPKQYEQYGSSTGAVRVGPQQSPVFMRVWTAGRLNYPPRPPHPQRRRNSAISHIASGLLGSARTY